MIQLGKQTFGTDKGVSDANVSAQPNCEFTTAESHWFHLKRQGNIICLPLCLSFTISNHIALEA